MTTPLSCSPLPLKVGGMHSHNFTLHKQLISSGVTIFNCSCFAKMEVLKQHIMLSARDHLALMGIPFNPGAQKVGRLVC